MSIKKGNKIKIEYTGTLDDGKVFDSSEKHGQPLELEVGSGKIIPGLDKALIGMKKDEEKEITVKPEEAYGERNEQFIKKIPRKQVPADQEPKPGMVLGLKSPDGRQFPAIITKVDDEELTIDLNHPLAGKTLNFKIKVVDISA